MSIYNKQRRESVNIILSNTDSAPIYEQITRQLRAKIVSAYGRAGAAVHAAARQGAAHQRHHDKARV